MQWGITSSGFDPWFSQVQVCYTWTAQIDSDQCSKESQNTLCASVNEFSTEYQDDTDKRPGGCFMQWRLVVPDNAPLWMKSVKLCFLWYADEDGDADQCGKKGPGISGEVCATAGSWTSVYRDDTDMRPGGCYM